MSTIADGSSRPDTRAMRGCGSWNALQKEQLPAQSQRAPCTGSLPMSQDRDDLAEGDQIGGTDPGRQTFRNLAFYDGATYYGAFGAPWLNGHCYNWAHWQVYSGTSWDVWTDNNHTNC